MKPDAEGMARLGINKDTEIGLIISEPGFEPYERDDDLHPNNHVKNIKKNYLIMIGLINLVIKGTIPGIVGLTLLKVKMEKFLVVGN